MEKIVKNRIVFITSLISAGIGAVWFSNSTEKYEPLIIVSISLIEILAYFLIPNKEIPNELNANYNSGAENNNINNNNMNLTLNIDSARKMEINSEPILAPQKNLTREEIIEIMRSKVGILFIDDDKKFDVVKMLKNSNWRNTKTIVDAKTLDMTQIKDADIIFIDINGVGKILNLPDEGLDLALMIKQKYENKTVVIYSANSKSNSFHKAWETCDYRLEKNALPIQFTNLVEQSSVNIFNSQH